MNEGGIFVSFLEVQALNYYYQDGDSRRYILKDVNVQFEKGKFYTILGQSGSGKTTFLSLIGALDSAHAGTVLLDGEDIKTIGYEKYRRDDVGMIFQSYNLIPYLTAVENVMVAMDVTDNKIPGEHQEIAYNLLDYIGISREKAGRLTNRLSGGEQQRIAIARALATNVDLILADEPTGNLDEEMENEIVAIFQKLAHEHNKCVIVVTHSKEIAEKSDQILYLRKGKLGLHE